MSSGIQFVSGSITDKGRVRLVREDGTEIVVPNVVFIRGTAVENGDGTVTIIPGSEA